MTTSSRSTTCESSATRSSASEEDFLLVKRLLEAGKYRPVIDRRYALNEIVEATGYVETGQKTGNVVLRVSEAADGRAGGARPSRST